MRKKLVGVLVIFIALFFSYIDVNALALNKGDRVYVSSADLEGGLSTKRMGIHFNGKDDNFLYAVQPHYYEGKTVYCLDPLYNSPASGLVVDHILLGEGTVEPRIEYAFLAMMKEAQNENYATNDEALTKHAALDTALRMFAGSTQYYAKTANYSKNGNIQPVMSAIMSTFQREFGYQSKLTKNKFQIETPFSYTTNNCKPDANGAMDCYLILGDDLVDIRNASVSVESINNTYEYLKKYIKVGFDAYNSYNSSKVSTVEVSSTNEDGIVTVVIEGKNFSGNGKVSFDGITNVEGNVKKVSDNGDRTKRIITFEALGKFSFDVKYSAADDNLMYGAFLKNTVKNEQSFLIYSSEVEGLYHVDASDSSCDIKGQGFNLPQLCGDDADDFETVNNGKNAIYEYDEGFYGDYFSASKCIVKKNDAAGNSYNATSLVGLQGNPYCEVYCKESFKFNVPYSRYAESGRYFQLSVKLEGTQTCYSTEFKNISKDKWKSPTGNNFYNDMISVMQSMMDAYYEWAYYKEMSEINLSNLPEGHEYCHSYKEETYSSTTYGGLESNCSGNYNSLNKSCTTSRNVCEQKGVIDSAETRTYTFTGKYYPKGNTLTQFNQLSQKYGLVTKKLMSENGKITFGYMHDGSCNSNCNGKNAKDHYDEQRFLQKLSETVTRLNNLIKEYNTRINSYNACATWSWDYNFNPTITYNYSEPNDYATSKKFMELSGVDNNMKEIESSQSDAPDKCCTGAINQDDYSCQNTSPDCSLKTPITYFGCSFDGNQFTCGNKTSEVSVVNYAKKEKSKSKKYDTPRVFYSVHPYGNIVAYPEGTSEEAKDPNAILVDGLPVSNATPNGTYYYSFTFSDLGVFNQSGSLGRVYGGTDSIAYKFNGSTSTPDGQELAANGYACKYYVGGETCVDDAGITHDKTECNGKDWDSCKKTLCPDNSSYCVKNGDNYYSCPQREYNGRCTKHDSRQSAIDASTINYNCCPNCKVVCIGNCIYSSNYEDKYQLALDYRVISNSNMQPNDHTAGYNWNSKLVDTPRSTLVAEKAYNTISEIEVRAKTDVTDISEEEFDNLNSYVMELTMTPEVADYIREYNKDSSAHGGYDDNSTLYCEDYEITGKNENSCTESGYRWIDGKCKATNIFCYDEFIDDLEEKYPNEFSAPGRKEAKDYAFNTYKGFAPLKGEGNIIANDYWTIYVYNNLDINSDGIPDIGPSWK